MLMFLFCELTCWSPLWMKYISLTIFNHGLYEEPVASKGSILTNDFNLQQRDYPLL